MQSSVFSSIKLNLYTILNVNYQSVRILWEFFGQFASTTPITIKRFFDRSFHYDFSISRPLNVQGASWQVNRDII